MHITRNELSDREREILSLVAMGASNKEIAQKLSISTNTVKVHLRNIFGKIGARSRTEAAMFAVSTGLDTGLPGASDNSPHVEIETVAQEPIANRYLRKPWAQINRLPGMMLILLVGLIFFYVLVILPSRRAELPIQPNAQWKQLPVMPTARSSLATVAYEQSIYAIGGKDDHGPSSVIEQFDTLSMSWKSLAPKPTPVYEIGAALIAGKIYVPGGRLSSGHVTDILEIYDLHQNSWTTGASLPLAVSAYGLAAFEGRLYLFGGWDGQGYINRVYEYIPDSDHWLEKTVMPTARGYLGVAQVGESLYVLGGYDGRNILRVNEKYKPGLDGGSENPWSKASELPEERYRMGVASTIDLLLTVGGISDNEQTFFLFQYSVRNDKWMHLDYPDNQKPWYDFGVTVVDTNVYMIGGEIDGKATNRALSCQVLYVLSLPVVPVQQP